MGFYLFVYFLIGGGFGLVLFGLCLLVWIFLFGWLCCVFSFFFFFLETHTW